MKIVIVATLAALMLSLSGCGGEDLNEESARQLLKESGYNPGGGSGNPAAGPGVTPIGYAPITLPGPTPIALTDDELSGPINIGFTFVFFGTPYTQLVISSNGFLSLDLGILSSGCCQGMPIPSLDGFNALIAFY